MRAKRTWVYTCQGEPLAEPYEAGADWSDTLPRAPTATEELVYGGVRATDGTPINSRKKHREYMKQNGLAMVSDYSDAFRAKEKASQKREDSKSRRETVARAWYQKFKP